jgi:hemoglobin
MSERKNPYEMIGGASKLEELVDRFYDLMALEESFFNTADWMRNQPN